MDKNGYKEIVGWAGMTLDEAVRDLQAAHADGLKRYITFNEVDLYSDTVTLDSAYLAVLGKTKAEYDQALADRVESYRKHKEAHERAIPELTKHWMEEGRKILNEKYWATWDECVPVRLNDLYEGMELGQSLEIIKMLNEGCALEDAKKVMSEQGHSGMSWGLMRAMVKTFCDRGTEFAEYTKL